MKNVRFKGTQNALAWSSSFSNPKTLKKGEIYIEKHRTEYLGCTGIVLEGVEGEFNAIYFEEDLSLPYGRGE